MLKGLHKDDTQLTPFVVTKDWEISNVTNEDLILMEHNGQDGLPVALEYLNYTPSGPISSSGCSIANEQQSLDKAEYYRIGQHVTGIFYPDQDPQNTDGTYQRMVYAQAATMFYNEYRDPTKVWGLEKLDFEAAKTKRFLNDRFKELGISQATFGEKIIPNTVVLYDFTTDNDFTITDDGNCNLFAGTNIFSRQQELGEFSNEYQSGSNSRCDYYFDVTVSNQPFLLPAPSNLGGIQGPPYQQAVQLSWSYDGSQSYANGFLLYRSPVPISVFDLIQTITSSYVSTSLDTAVSYSHDYGYKIYAYSGSTTSSYYAGIFGQYVSQSLGPPGGIPDISASLTGSFEDI